MTNLADVRLKDATLEQWREFWEAYGFEPFGPGAKDHLPCWGMVYKRTKDGYGLGVNWRVGTIVRTYWELDEGLGNLYGDTTLGLALDILNTIANNDSLGAGGWVDAPLPEK